jgi:hypothetical protein
MAGRTMHLRPSQAVRGWHTPPASTLATAIRHRWYIQPATVRIPTSCCRLKKQQIRGGELLSLSGMFLLVCLANHRRKCSYGSAGDRTFFSDVTVFDQPLVTVFPGGDARLPIESQVLDQCDTLDPASLSNIPVSCLTSPKVGGFSRTAQATCLLDQVLIGFDTPDIDSGLLQLDRLDANFQSFPSLVMPQCQGQSGIFCSAMNIAIRPVHAYFPLL